MVQSNCNLGTFYLNSRSTKFSNEFPQKTEEKKKSCPPYVTHWRYIWLRYINLRNYWYLLPPPSSLLTGEQIEEKRNVKNIYYFLNGPFLLARHLKKIWLFDHWLRLIWSLNILTIWSLITDHLTTDYLPFDYWLLLIWSLNILNIW